jgi:leader peptidase (prepilin peptidase) / N-methyltransferase
MSLLLYSVVFVFGLSVGSFLNSVIYRLEKEESFLKGRSYCPECRHLLSFLDLIPVFSFLVLRGKCRYCKKPISWQYPLVELAAGIIFLLIFNYQLSISNQSLSPNYQTLFSIFYFLIISCFLIIIFVYDLRHYIIPDKVVYPAILVSGIWYLASGIFFGDLAKYQILNAIYSAAGAAAFFLFIVLISRGKWMGVGDIKLAAFMGLILGYPGILVALFLAFFTGAIMGVGLIISGKKKLSSEIPFGPFLTVGTFLAFFWGQSLISWYFDVLAV